MDTVAGSLKFCYSITISVVDVEMFMLILLFYDMMGGSCLKSVFAVWAFFVAVACSNNAAIAFDLMASFIEQDNIE